MNVISNNFAGSVTPILVFVIPDFFKDFFLCKLPDTRGLKATSRCGLQLFDSRGHCHLLLGLKQGYPFTVHTDVCFGIINPKPGRGPVSIGYICLWLQFLRDLNNLFLKNLLQKIFDEQYDMQEGEDTKPEFEHEDWEEG